MIGGTTIGLNCLAQLSSEYPRLGLVMVGSPDETERCNAILQHWKGPFANACARSTPRGTAALLERCALFIGHDSGPAHLAAATGAQVIAIFSWYNAPGKWFPGHYSWETVHVLYPPLPSGKWQESLRNKRGINEGVMAIMPSTVIQLVRELLDRTANLQ